MANIELTGVDEILNKLQQIGANVGRLENKALKNAAEPVLEDAKGTNAFNDRSGNLREGLKISNVKKKDGSKYILVGVDKGDNSKIFYDKFLEFGTSKMPARPFLQPAYEKNKNTIQKTIAETLKEGLK
ncbi:HK97-gp10 family putative phage morphogenesis protein [Clostridium sp. HMP27]|uniref:HK97-gp10 family putative phage morphogenesis protein n=1 Tax=Clostridium sp. HMP27 TaxID=1487921 RepID=UPI00052B7D8B|nr:HK97-gp10 family putative phage morphogenesis protein [Clostridium sp. HMP27]KGK87367.1 phage protein, HK97 gp10 family [Clostridium sp. HMP27]